MAFVARTLTVASALLLASIVQSSASGSTRFLSASETPPGHIGDRILVARGQQVRYHLHVFDLALYLSSTSSLWGTYVTAEQLIKGAPGVATIRYDIVSPFVTKERIGQAVEEKVKAQVSSDEWEAIDGVFVERLQQGPFKGVGAVIEMALDSDGVRIKMDGKDMGKVTSSALPIALLSIYFDEHASNQEFIKASTERIAQGLPDSATSVSVVVDRRAASMTHLLIGIIACVLTVILGICVLRVFVCASKRGLKNGTGNSGQ